MCGIMGFCDKTERNDGALGPTMLKMLTALGNRGPDSAGIAFYARERGDGACLVRIKLGERGTHENRAGHVVQRVGTIAHVLDQQHDAEYLRLVIDRVDDPRRLASLIEELDREVEVISLGLSLEIVKQVGSPQHLERRFHLSSIRGTHAIAHTRLSTESRIDLSHSQPFWAHGSIDVATVHNGHITNYHKLRRQYEERGVRFYTENDSEIIGIFLAEMLASGASLRAALDSSMAVFDGSYSYLAATAHEIGFAKDPFGFKPLIVTETDDFVALATEEIALRAAFGEEVTTWEPPPGTVRTWPVGQAAPQPARHATGIARSAPASASVGSEHGRG